MKEVQPIQGQAVYVNSPNAPVGEPSTFIVDLTAQAQHMMCTTNTTRKVARYLPLFSAPGTCILRSGGNVDVRLTESENARSEQLYWVQLTDWEWLSGELLNGSECSKAWLLFCLSTGVLRHRDGIVRPYIHTYVFNELDVLICHLAVVEEWMVMHLWSRWSGNANQLLANRSALNTAWRPYKVRRLFRSICT